MGEGLSSMFRPPMKLSSKLELKSPTSSRSTEDRNLFRNSGCFTLDTFLLLLVFTGFSPGVFEDGITHVLNSHLKHIRFKKKVSTELLC